MITVLLDKMRLYRVYIVSSLLLNLVVLTLQKKVLGDTDKKILNPRCDRP